MPKNDQGGMDKVFLICSDCYIEQAIRDEYGDGSYFITALGTVFDFAEFEPIEEVNQFLVRNDITYIYIVNDIACTFIQNVIEGGIKYNTDAEKTLLNILENNREVIDKLANNREKARKIANINILRQAYELSESPFLDTKIEDGKIILKGLIYDREEKSFTDQDLNF